jgi:hypothetical protein
MPTTKTTKRAYTEYEMSYIYWSDVYRINDGPKDDGLEAAPMIDIQCFWRWLKNLDYNDGTVTKINTPGANSRAAIIAQIRVMYPDLRAREVRGYLKKEVAVVWED